MNLAQVFFLKGVPLHPASKIKTPACFNGSGEKLFYGWGCGLERYFGLGSENGRGGESIYK